MKQATRCLGCNRVVRKYGSFKIKLADRLNNPLTGESRPVDVVGNLCRECAEYAGYTINRAHKKRGGVGVGEIHGQKPNSEDVLDVQEISEPEVETEE